MTPDTRPKSLRGTRLPLSELLEWPRGIARLGVILCVTLAVVFGVIYAGKSVKRMSDEADRNASFNYDDREFGGGNSIVVDKRALYEARALIPPSGTYRVVTGPGVKGATELTEAYVDQFARYFLMPRRPASDAKWILCYGCDVSQLGAGFHEMWTNGEGIVLGTTVDQ